MSTEESEKLQAYIDEALRAASHDVASVATNAEKRLEKHAHTQEIWFGLVISGILVLFVTTFVSVFIWAFPLWLDATIQKRVQENTNKELQILKQEIQVLKKKAFS